MASTQMAYSQRGLYWTLFLKWASQVTLVVKNPPANAGDRGLIPTLRGSPGRGHGNWLQYSCFGQRSPAGYSPYQCRVRHSWSNYPHTCILKEGPLNYSHPLHSSSFPGAFVVSFITVSLPGFLTVFLCRKVNSIKWRLTCSLLFAQPWKCCLQYSRHSINIYWMNKPLVELLF